MGTYNIVVKYLNTLWGTKETITTIRRSMRSIVPTSSRRTSTLSLSLWDYLVLKFEVPNRKRYKHDKIRTQPKVSLLMIINKITINDIKNLAVKWTLVFCTFTDNKILCHSFIMCWYSGQTYLRRLRNYPSLSKIWVVFCISVIPVMIKTVLATPGLLTISATPPMLI